ncbi:MAG TPA: DUF1573 domain-containing protein [Chthoniobacterales bacterium]
MIRARFIHERACGLDRRLIDIFPEIGRRMAVVIGWLIIPLALATPGFGQLTWHKPRQAFTPGPLEKEVVAHYQFVNLGNAPVVIRDVRTSCGCTTTALAKREYGPGEAGEIEAKFQFMGRIGHQEKWIYVTTNLLPEEPTLLRLVVDIPEAVKVEPELLLWRLGDPFEPKTFRVSVADNFPAKVVSVRSNDPAVKLEIHETLPCKMVEVIVTPALTGKPENATIAIQTDYPPGRPDVYHAFVRVK